MVQGWRGRAPGGTEVKKGGRAPGGTGVGEGELPVVQEWRRESSRWYRGGGGKSSRWYRGGGESSRWYRGEEVKRGSKAPWESLLAG